MVYKLCVSACNVPDTVALTAGHVASSIPAAGAEFYIDSNSTLYCDPLWTFEDGSSSKAFTCVEEAVPWENCSGQ